jgi:hypothetical protein
MSITRKFCLVGFLFIACMSCVYAQVQKVNFQIKYNKTTCLYDCCIIIKEGSARSALHRAQFSSQYSIVVPAGSALDIVASRMPLQNNQNYTGTQPANWQIGSAIYNPASLPGSDIYGITPSLAPTSFYNNLNTGDTVALFSLRINPTIGCGIGIRPFENGVDPGSGAEGMEGGDFSNGFTLGGVNQKYTGNQATALAPKPQIQTLTTACSSGLEINLQATTQMCQLPLSYAWVGPDGYQSTTRDVNIINPTAFSSGNYRVKITDAYGCFDTVTVLAFAKPKAGSDQYVRCYLSGVASISAEGSGTWTVGQGSAGSAIIENNKQSVTRVSDFTNPGLYYLVWSTEHCSDTLIVNAGSNCVCNISNNISLPNEHSFCISSGTVVLNGNAVPGTGTYRWIASKNGGVYQNATGANSSVNYQIDGVGTGQYRYRRIFNAQSPVTCSDTSNIVYINVFNRPNAGPDITLNCPAVDTAFLHSPDIGFWAIGQGSAGSAFMSAITPQSVYLTSFSTYGKYYVARSNYVCTDTMVIQVYDLCGCNTANAGPDKVKCAGDTIRLSGSCRIGRWSPLPNNPVGAVIDTLGNGKAVVHFASSAAGPFRFVYTINNLLFDTMVVTVYSNPVISAGQDFGFCSDQNVGPIILTASGGISYIWSTGQPSNSINVNPQSTTAYGVKGFDTHGCSATDSITISVFQSPQGATPVIPPVYEYEPLMLNAGIWQNAASYLWTGPNSFIANQPVVMISNAAMENDGMYTLTITSPDDCTVYMNVPVHVMQRPLSTNGISFQGFWDETGSLNHLHWSAEYQKNVLYYIVERYDDSDKTFMPVTTIPASKDQVNKNNYFYQDRDIVAGNEFLYRLKTVYSDQSIQYSDIIHIITKSKLTSLSYILYPNPARDEVSLFLTHFPAELSADINIYNAEGIELFSKSWSEIDKNQNILEGFSADLMNSGMYVCRIRYAGQVLNVRFSIVK